MTYRKSILICFAMKEEASFFRKPTSQDLSVSVLITGIGAANTERQSHRALKSETPDLVITAGFAGGLNPSYQTGQLIFEADDDFPLNAQLRSTGAKSGTFLLSNRIVANAQAKAKLWQDTAKDAVEMESGVIRAICRDRDIPSATLRVISDAAHEDLPLDFNEFMTSQQRMHFGRLAIHLIKSPGTLSRLLRFNKRLRQCSRSLAQALECLLETRAQVTSSPIH